MPADRVSRRQFAKLDGCSEKLVRRGIEKGALHVGADGLLDAALAGTAWREGNVRSALLGDAHVANPSAVAAALADAAEARGAVPPLAQSIAKKEHYLSLLRELEFKQRDGELIQLATAKNVLFAEFRAIRNALLGWPSKVAAEIAAEIGVEADLMTATLTARVHRLVADLAEPSARVLNP